MNGHQPQLSLDSFSAKTKLSSAFIGKNVDLYAESLIHKFGPVDSINNNEK